MSTVLQERRRGGVLRALDKITGADGTALISDQDIVRLACLAALVGCGLHIEADEMAKRDEIGKADAIAALGLLLATNLSAIGTRTKLEVMRIGEKV